MIYESLFIFPENESEDGFLVGKIQSDILCREISIKEYVIYSMVN